MNKFTILPLGINMNLNLSIILFCLFVCLCVWVGVDSQLTGRAHKTVKKNEAIFNDKAGVLSGS